MKKKEREDEKNTAKNRKKDEKEKRKVVAFLRSSQLRKKEKGKKGDINAYHRVPLKIHSSSLSSLNTMWRFFDGGGMTGGSSSASSPW